MTGWVSFEPPAGFMAAAAERAAKLDSEADVTWAGRVQSYATPQERAVGAASEDVFEGWLQHMNAPYIRHGGIDALPDFEVKGMGVALRCCGAHVPYKPSHIVYVFDAHLEKFPHWFFLGYEREAGRFLLLGGATRSKFKGFAHFADTGASVVPGFVASAPLWYAPTTVLTPPIPWLDAL